MLALSRAPQTCAAPAREASARQDQNPPVCAVRDTSPSITPCTLSTSCGGAVPCQGWGTLRSRTGAAAGPVPRGTIPWVRAGPGAMASPRSPPRPAPHLGAELVEVVHVAAHRLRHGLAGEVEQPHGGRGSARPARPGPAAAARLSLSIGGRTFRTAAAAARPPPVHRDRAPRPGTPLFPGAPPHPGVPSTPSQAPAAGCCRPCAARARPPSHVSPKRCKPGTSGPPCPLPTLAPLWCAPKPRLLAPQCRSPCTQGWHPRARRPPLVTPCSPATSALCGEVAEGTDPVSLSPGAMAQGVLHPPGYPGAVASAPLPKPGHPKLQRWGDPAASTALH